MNEVFEDKTSSENKSVTPVNEVAPTPPEPQKVDLEVTDDTEKVPPVIEVKNPKIELVDDTVTTSNETTLTKPSKAKTTGILSGLGATVASLFAGI